MRTTNLRARPIAAMCPIRGDQLHPMPAAVDPLSQLSCPLRRSDCASHRSTRRAGSPRPAPRFWCGDPRGPLAWRCPTGTSAERSEPGISAFVGHWLPRVGLPTRPPDETGRCFAVHRCPDHPTRPVTSIQLLVRTQKAGRRTLGLADHHSDPGGRVGLGRGAGIAPGPFPRPLAEPAV
jgi:hypothetical protein